MYTQIHTYTKNGVCRRASMVDGELSATICKSQGWRWGLRIWRRLPITQTFPTNTHNCHHHHQLLTNQPPQHITNIHIHPHHDHSLHHHDLTSHPNPALTIPKTTCHHHYRHQPPQPTTDKTTNTITTTINSNSYTTTNVLAQYTAYSLLGITWTVYHLNNNKFRLIEHLKVTRPAIEHNFPFNSYIWMKER